MGLSRRRRTARRPDGRSAHIHAGALLCCLPPQVPPLFERDLKARSRMIKSSYDYLFAKPSLRWLFGDYLPPPGVGLGRSERTLDTPASRACQEHSPHPPTPQPPRCAHAGGLHSVFFLAPQADQLISIKAKLGTEDAGGWGCSAISQPCRRQFRGLGLGLQGEGPQDPAGAGHPDPATARPAASQTPRFVRARASDQAPPDLGHALLARGGGGRGPLPFHVDRCWRWRRVVRAQVSAAGRR